MYIYFFLQAVIERRNLFKHELLIILSTVQH